MTIEIQTQELEALIRQRMQSGIFQNVDELLLQALKPPAEDSSAGLSATEFHRRQFLDWISRAGSGWNMELHPELDAGADHWVELLRREDDEIDFDSSRS